MKVLLYSFIFILILTIATGTAYFMMSEPKQTASVKLHAQFTPLVTAPEAGRAEFTDLDVNQAGELIRMEGFVLDEGRGVDAPVVMMCSGQGISDAEIPANGFFSISSRRECEEGNFVWLETEYQGVVYESDYYPIREREPAGGTKFEPVKRRIKLVPEFSLFGLFLVVVIGSIGIGIIRK